MALVSDPILLQELATLREYYLKVVRPVQLQRISDAVQKQRNKEDGHHGNTAVRDHSESAVCGVDGIHVPVPRPLS